MRGSRIVPVVAMVLLVGFMVPTLCLALTTGNLNPSGGGCHERHGPMPGPSHSCCYAGHQLPAAVAVASVRLAGDSAAAVFIGALASDRLSVGNVTSVADDSPPLVFVVLRI